MTKEQQLNGVITYCLACGFTWDNSEEGRSFWEGVFLEFDIFSRYQWYEYGTTPGNVQLVAQGQSLPHYAAAAIFLLIKKYPKKYAKYQHLIARLNEIGDELTSGVK